MRLIESEGEVVIKEAEESCGGHGVFFFDAARDDAKSFWAFCNKTKHDLVVQAIIKQSPILDRLNPSSVNTVRIVSHLRMDGSVKIYSAILRMGVNGSRVDNASSGGITCGISSDGRLKDVAYSASGDKYYEHPNSHVKFGTVVVPGFQDALGVAKRCQRNFGHFRLLSWDFAINESGIPVLIEVNLSYGQLDFHQLNNGPIFGDDLPKILDEVFAKKR